MTIVKWSLRFLIQKCIRRHSHAQRGTRSVGVQLRLLSKVLSLATDHFHDVHFVSVIF